MEIAGKVALVTGAARGIGHATAEELLKRGASFVAMVDLSDDVKTAAEALSKAGYSGTCEAFQGDTTDPEFRSSVFAKVRAEHGPVSICVPAAGVTRDSLAIRLDKETGKADVYGIDKFRFVLEVNLTAPIYWGLEMVAHLAEDRAARGLKRWHPDEGDQGAIIFIGSVSSQGNKGQLSYSATKAGLVGAASTLQKEGMFYGIRTGVIHPGFTDTPMVGALGDEYIEKNVLSATQLKRLIKTSEIADAICFMIQNAAMTGELWADAGWHPAP